jgi:hypothetical protein
LASENSSQEPVLERKLCLEEESHEEQGGEGKIGHQELPTGPRSFRKGWAVDGRIDTLSFDKQASLNSRTTLKSQVP